MQANSGKLLQELYNIEQNRKIRMINYLDLKVSERDWHGVADAAMDLREIDTRILLLEKLKNDNSTTIDR